MSAASRNRAKPGKRQKLRVMLFRYGTAWLRGASFSRKRAAGVFSSASMEHHRIISNVYAPLGLASSASKAEYADGKNVLQALCVRKSTLISQVSGFHSALCEMLSSRSSEVSGADGSRAVRLHLQTACFKAAAPSVAAEYFLGASNARGSAAASAGIPY